MTARQYQGAWPLFRILILQRDQWQCQIRLPGCKHRATQVDHIIGIQQGGAWLDPTNCRGACRSCNIAKGNRDNPRTKGRPWLKRNPSREW